MIRRLVEHHQPRKMDSREAVEGNHLPAVHVIPDGAEDTFHRIGLAGFDRRDDGKSFLMGHRPLRRDVSAGPSRWPWFRSASRASPHVPSGTGGVAAPLSGLADGDRVTPLGIVVDSRPAPRLLDALGKRFTPVGGEPPPQTHRYTQAMKHRQRWTPSTDSSARIICGFSIAIW